MTRTADLLKVTTHADSGAETLHFTNLQVAVPLASNGRYVDTDGTVAVRIDDLSDWQPSTVWSGSVTHQHALDDADQVLATATDALAREGFRPGDWTCDGAGTWTAGIEPLPPVRRCRCGQPANRVFTPLDPLTGEPDEASTFYRCSLHAYDPDVPQENIRQRQICWRGIEFGPEPHCLELIEYVEGPISGWMHVDRRLTRSHHAVPRNR